VACACLALAAAVWVVFIVPSDEPFDCFGRTERCFEDVFD
jgi:hypothetical protein